MQINIVGRLFHTLERQEAVKFGVPVYGSLKNTIKYMT